VTIFLRHPEVDGVIEATDIGGDGGETQARHYEARDWVRIEPVLLAAAAIVGHDVESLDALTKDELSEVAVRSHIDVDAKATKTDLVKAIDAGFGADQEADLSIAIADANTEAALSDTTTQES
jgi:hypothetical protein